MKWALILLLLTGSFAMWLCNKKTKLAPKAIRRDTVAIRNQPVNFKTQLVPVFQKNCSPCHFSGGKMYEKMPFDSSQTILLHGTGILKRIKDEKENALLRQYLDQNKKPG